MAAAGLSNEAFYRHFRSKEALVTAILEDGAERLHGYLAHQLAKEATPELQVRRWVEGVLAQAAGGIAATTLAVLWNGSSADGGIAAGRHFASAPLASLLHEPFAALGSDTPELDAALAAHATLGMLSDCLWRRTPPTQGRGRPGHRLLPGGRDPLTERDPAGVSRGARWAGPRGASSAAASP